LSFAQLQEELRKKVAEAEEKGQAHEKTLAENQQLFKELETEKSKVLKGKALRHLAEKVEEKAMELLEKDERFVKMLSGGTCSAFVLSIDLRKSTTLMLKARDPQLYAMFIRDLCDKLYSAVLANHGVFDKFTGDGVLAFFPDFYSGNDACYWAIKTASQCHAIFAEEYRKHRNCFASVLSDVGLGIGIDFGSVDLVSLWGGLTVVGAPVVYACRMGSAPAGTTLLNHPAYEKASEQYSAHCSFRETTVEVKGEGPTVAYDVELDKRPYDPALPDWPDLIAEREKSNPNSALRANFNGGVNREPQNLTNR
jgi:class 3 adenylate cyclase